MLYRPVSSPSRRRIAGRVHGLLAVLSVLALTACLDAPRAQTTPEPEPVTVAARWDHLPEAEIWTSALMQALLTDGAPMLALIPDDADNWCPGYATASQTQRAAFYVGVFSGLARVESTWNPEASGAGGRYRGLLQIAPATAAYHDCDLGQSGLYDGATNLACAVRIANRSILRDQVIAQEFGGIAAHWPPLRRASVRDDIAAFTLSLPQCAG